MDDQMRALYDTVVRRRDEQAEGSYTGYLFEQGLNKMLKKIGEECAETIIAAKDGDRAALVSELCDLHYHLAVLMAAEGVTPDDIAAELARRAQKEGNLKSMKTVDKNT